MPLPRYSYSFASSSSFFQVEESLRNVYRYLQRLAVGLEQVVLDQILYDGRFVEEFNEAEFKLKAVSYTYFQFQLTFLTELSHINLQNVNCLTVSNLNLIPKIILFGKKRFLPANIFRVKSKFIIQINFLICWETRFLSPIISKFRSFSSRRSCASFRSPFWRRASSTRSRPPAGSCRPRSARSRTTPTGT